MVTTVAGVAQQNSILLGSLPGSLSSPLGITVFDTNTVALTTADNVVLKLVIPKK